MEGELRVQADLLDKIQKAYTNFKKSPKERITQSYTETRLESLESDWTDYKHTHKEIVKHTKASDKEKIPYFNNDVYDIVEDTYITYKSELKALLFRFEKMETTAATTTSKNTKPEVNLPKINIPEFSGKYHDWTSFHDLFDSLVNRNESLDDVQKLSYLKSSVRGEAQQLLKTIAVTSENYKIAWDILIRRYNNKRYLSNSIFKQLFAIRVVNTESAHNIKQLLDGTVECINSLKNLGLPTEEWDAILVYITTSKMDADSLKLWEQHISTEKNELPTFKTLADFLETRFRSLEIVDQTARPFSSVRRPKAFHVETAENDLVQCAFCKERHYIYQCKGFAKESFNDRKNFVQNNGLCFNCLIPNHSANRCMRNSCCRICRRKHHSLLHPEGTKTTAKNVTSGEKTKQIETHFIKQPDQVLLPTALVNINSEKDEKQVYRALIDQGSQASFVTEKLVQSAGLKRVQINGVVSGLKTRNTLRTKYMVELEIESRVQPEYKIRIQAYVLKSITNYLPSKHIKKANFSQIETNTLADQGYNTPSKIDVLLGAEVYCQIIDTGLIKSPSGIIAQKTHLGWILSGDTNSNKPAKIKNIINMHLCVEDEELHKKFWEIENKTFTSDTKLSEEENRCESINKQTTTKTENNKYNLPFKEGCEAPIAETGKTIEKANNRYIQTERDFKANENLKQDNIELEQMTEAEEDNPQAICKDKDTSKPMATTENLALLGVTPSTLTNNQAWWKGPTWLSNLKQAPKQMMIPETKEEIRKQTQINRQNTNNIDEVEDKVWEGFSSLTKMIRILTYCRRFLNLESKNRISNTTYLQINEMKETQYNINKLVQGKELDEEINDLINKTQNKKKVKILTLSRYLEEDVGSLRLHDEIQAEGTLITLPDQKHDEQTRTQHFWQRWLKKFLYTKQQRYKWHRKKGHKEPRIGDNTLLQHEAIS